jgi:dUTP pyrophosphatase
MSERKPIVRVRRLSHSEGLPLPDYSTAGSAGMDLRAAVKTEVRMRPGERARIPTGLCLEIPDGFEGQVRPRSGLASRKGITVLNSPGTVDSDYRGEVQVILINLGQEEGMVSRGDRIAQITFHRVERVELEEAEELEPTSRGGEGFGHTGVT